MYQKLAWLVLLQACAGRCEGPCSRDADCPPGYTCNMPADGPTSCAPREAAGGRGGAAGATAGSGGTAALATPCAADPLCKSPPSATSGAPLGDGAGPTTLVIAVLRIGDADMTGKASASAWQGYGYNVDGLAFPAPATAGHCAPQAGAKPRDVVVDGPGGLDNSFGKNLIPLLFGLASDLPQRVQNSIATGEATHVLRLQGLGAGADENLGAPLAPSTFFPVLGMDDGAGGIAPPGADWTSYTWRTQQDAPSATFAQSYLAGNTWVSGPPQDIPLVLHVGSGTLGLVLHHAVITVPLSSDHTQGGGGIISGVLGVEELVVAMKAFLPSVSKSLCTATILDGVLGQIRQAADMMGDGTQDPNSTCDGISIGLGFDVRLSSLATTLAPPSPLKDPCSAM